jgi:undecaprenyl phosphate-alpha-L-ara4N flippase subunit ArnF
MQTHSLAMVAVLYSTATLVLLTLLGVVVFRESLGFRDALGVTLALAAVLVMQKPE